MDSFSSTKEVIVFDASFVRASFITKPLFITISMENFMNNLMVQQLTSPQGMHQETSLFVSLRTFGLKTVLLSSNQLLLDGLLMLRFYYFDQRNTLRNLQVISINSIKWFGMDNCSLSFLDIKISCKNNKFVTPFTVSLHLVKFSQILKVLYETYI